MTLSTTTKALPTQTQTQTQPHPQPIPENITLGTRTRLPEFNLAGKIICISGAARGLGLTQAEALLEAGATVYALDRLEEPVPLPFFSSPDPSLRNIYLTMF